MEARRAEPPYCPVELAGIGLSAAAIPETGRDRLFEYYRRVIDGRQAVERGDHAVF